MQEARSSDVKARLPEFLDAVERGETIVVTRHGRAIAHIVPAPADRERVRRAIDGIAALRRKTRKMTVAEILAARHETGRA